MAVFVGGVVNLPNDNLQLLEDSITTRVVSSAVHVVNTSPKLLSIPHRLLCGLSRAHPRWAYTISLKKIIFIKEKLYNN